MKQEAVWTDDMKSRVGERCTVYLITGPVTSSGRTMMGYTPVFHNAGSATLPAFFGHLSFCLRR